MKTLRPQILKDVHYTDIEQQLKRVFYEILFKPVAQVLRQYTAQPAEAKKTLLNALDDALRDALNKGRIQYGDGVFSGEFSAAIGRDLRTLGASFDKRTKVYRLAAGRVPAWVKAAAVGYNAKAKEAHNLILKTLDDNLRDLDKMVDIHTIDPAEAIDSIEDDFNRIAGGLIVDPRLTPEGKGRLEQEYRDNMKLWIKKFSKRTITDLREIVEENANQGYRFDNLIRGIKTRYGVTTSKAKFLARQETALYMSKYRKERFGEAGVTRYKWSTSHDARVRPYPGMNPAHGDHRDLDGKIFEYARPPIVATMPRIRRANPGEDYNCRCLDIPILEAIAEAA
jgi:SPP1 gp7 family putative phage head morphogenesis protein